MNLGGNVIAVAAPLPDDDRVATCAQHKRRDFLNQSFHGLSCFNALKNVILKNNPKDWKCLYFYENLGHFICLYKRLFVFLPSKTNRSSY